MSIAKSKKYCKPVYTRYVEVTGTDGQFLYHLRMGTYPQAVQ